MQKYKQKINWKRVKEYCKKFHPKLRKDIKNRLPNFKEIKPVISLKYNRVIEMVFYFKKSGEPFIAEEGNSSELKNNLESIALIAGQEAEKYNLRVIQLRSESGLGEEGFYGYEFKPKYQDFAIK